MKPFLDRAYLLSGQPHILLAPEHSPGWQSLRSSYKEIQQEIQQSDADLILYFSTQWLSVIGYLFQADPEPMWTHVDQNWHDLGSIPYQFRVDSSFAKTYRDEVKTLGHNSALVDYRGFPIDTGTIVAQKLINPENRIPAAMVSCNMYAEKQETLEIGRAAARALQKSNKKAIAVLVSSLSNRYFHTEIDPKEDRIHSQKDDEWNLKICELLKEGRLEDVSQCAREFAREAHGDMGFKGIWWLSGLCGETNQFTGKVFDYQPVWGTGAALIGLTPQASPTSKEEKTNSDEIINSKNAPLPVGAYPHARQSGDWVYLSGVGPRARNSKEIPGVVLNQNGEVMERDIREQTRSVIQNVQEILSSAGCHLKDIVDIQVFLTHMKEDFQGFNEVYRETFQDLKPTRTTIEVGSLPTPIAVEFKVVARKPS